MFYGVHPYTTRNFEETTLKKTPTYDYFTSKKYASSCVYVPFLPYCLTCQSVLEKHRYNCHRRPTIISYLSITTDTPPQVT